MDTGESMEMKIHKMTLQAAENIGLDSIGSIKLGNYADMVLFDPKEFKDNATFKESTLRSSGLKMVFVSGEVVYDGNRPTQVYSGRTILR